MELVLLSVDILGFGLNRFYLSILTQDIEIFFSLMLRFGDIYTGLDIILPSWIYILFTSDTNVHQCIPATVSHQMSSTKYVLIDKMPTARQFLTYASVLLLKHYLSELPRLCIGLLSAIRCKHYFMSYELPEQIHLYEVFFMSLLIRYKLLSFIFGTISVKEA